MLKDSILLDKLKQGFGYRTDIELAGFLNVSRNYIGLVRRGEMKLGIAQKIKILDRLMSIEVRDFLAKISPRELSEEIVNLSRRGAEKLALNELSNGDATEDDINLLFLFKEFSGFERDEDLAKYLGIKRSTISGVRTGKSKLGPLPRLRILKFLNLEDLSDIERGLESSEYLANLIDKHIQIQKNIKN